MCERPFTIFKWKAYRGESFRSTEVCQACSKTKNLCQSCILDLQCGLPSQLRDAVLSADGGLAEAESQKGKEFQTQQRLALMASGVEPEETPAEQLIKVARLATVNRDDGPLGSKLLGKRHLDMDRNANEAVAKSNSKNGTEVSQESKSISIVGYDNLHSIHSEGDSKKSNSLIGNGQKVSDKKNKKKKNKFTPKPPSMAPPPSAFL